MDLYCQKCGEPWEHYYIMHDICEDDGAEAKDNFLSGKGCPCCSWGEKAPEKKPFRSEIAAAMADIMGDDVDGIASSMDDAEYLYGDSFWE